MAYLRLRVVLVAHLACLCASLQASVATALELYVTPSITVSEQYSDNFFRADQDEVAVWLTQVRPGIAIEALTDRSRLNFLYSAGYFVHYSADERLSDFDYLGHDMSLFAATRLYTRLTIGMSDNLVVTREPGSTDALNQLVTQDLYWRNRVAPSVTYDIAEKGQAKLGFRNEVLNYIEVEGEPREDSMENRGILSLTYHLNDRNHLDLENQYWHRDYSGDSSAYDSYQSKVIYRREMSSYLDGQVGAGYHLRQFEQEDLNDIATPAFHIGLLGHTDLTKLNVSFEHNMVDFTQEDVYFTAYRGIVFAQRLFVDVIRAYVGGYYQFSSYEDQPRDDSSWGMNAGVGYSFLNKMFEVGIEYSRQDRDSNIQGFDYAENQVILRLTFNYDFGRRKSE